MESGEGRIGEEMQASASSLRVEESKRAMVDKRKRDGKQDVSQTREVQDDEREKERGKWRSGSKPSSSVRRE